MSSTTTYSEVRRNLKSVMDQACQNREPVRITRKQGGDVVVVAAEDFSSLEETAYLLRSPANARRLTEAVNRDRNGQHGRSWESVAEALGLEAEISDED